MLVGVRQFNIALDTFFKIGLSEPCCPRKERGRVLGERRQRAKAALGLQPST